MRAICSKIASYVNFSSSDHSMSLWKLHLEYTEFTKDFYMFERKSLPVKSNMPSSAAALVMINIGAGLDIPTGSFLPGPNGEYMLNGGLGIVWGITGKGNNFKTTLLEWAMGRAAARSSFDMDTDITVYDTEENKDAHRILRLLRANPEFAERNPFAEGTYTITGKSEMYGDKWFEGLKQFLEEKEKNTKALMQPTPFLSVDKKSVVQIMQPTFSLIDSFSEFETSDIAKIMDENLLGEAGGNTVYMRQNLAKNRLLMEYPRLGVGNQHYLLTSAHFGKELQMASGPYAPPPEKKMNSMRPGDKVKGVPDKYFYLVHWLGHASGSAVLKNKDNVVDYPKDSDDKRVGDTDLWEVPVATLRSKSGSSSWSTTLVVSQTEGVKPSLTEFHMLRKSRFALVGNDQNYVNCFMPEEKLSRTVVRRKLDSNAALRRATNIASEMYQMTIYQNVTERDILMDPEEVYAKVKENGYNWDMILNRTRGWWKTYNDRHPLLPLSTKDILNMAHGKYHPYWLESDKQTIKKEYDMPGDYQFY